MYMQQPQVNGFNAMQSVGVTVNFVRGFLIQQPISHPIDYRPLEVVFNPDSLNRLMNATNGGVDLDHVAIRDIARDIVAPSRQSKGKVSIAGGWNESRLAVFLEFEVRTPDHIRREVICGYTDHNGVSPQLNVAPELMIFPNSHMIISESIISGPNGNQTQYRVMGNEQILRPITVQATNGGVFSGQNTMRPFDMMSSLQTAGARNEAAVIDPRHMMLGQTNMGIASNRENNISSRYLSNVLTAFRKSSEEVKSSLLGATRNAQLGMAGKYVRETRLDSRVLFNFLSSRTELEAKGYLTYGELEYIFPNLNNNIEKSQISTKNGIMDNRNLFTDTSDVSIESQIATAFSHCIPTIMSKLQFVNVSFTVSNETLTGETIVSLEYIQPMFADIADEAKAQVFVNSITMDVVPEVLYGRVGSFSIDVTCAILGGTDCLISVDGRPVIPKSVVNYCDNLSTSMTSANETYLHNEAAVLGRMLDDVFQPNNDQYLRY